MALGNMEGILSIMPFILRDLPLIMGFMQIIGFIFLSLFFGSIAVRGYKGYANTWVRFAARLGIGFFCLVLGFVIAEFIPVGSDNPFIVLIQKDFVNMSVGGLIASFFVMGAIYLATHNVFDVMRMRNHINKMQEKLKHAEKITKEESKKPKLKRIAEPHRIAGILIITALLVFVSLGFKGFPDATGSLLSAVGLEPGDIDKLLEELGADKQMPAGCENLLVLLQEHNDEILNGHLKQVDNQNVRDIVSSEGHEAISMLELNHNDDIYILAITNDSYMCHVKEGRLCGCMDVSSFMKIS